MSTELTSGEEEGKAKELDKIKQLQQNRERRNAIHTLPEDMASVFTQVKKNKTQDKPKNV